MRLITAYIGLGSNLDDPVVQIRRARLAISEISGVQEISMSGLYSSSPMGPADQPDYVNSVISVETSLAPHDLLKCLQRIENQQGRVRIGERWGPRTLDLDILIFGDEIIRTADLIVPHIGIADRAFVLYPLAEIAPCIFVPGKGLLQDLLARCPKEGLQRLE